jgi:ANTAR domain
MGCARRAPVVASLIVTAGDAAEELANARNEVVAATAHTEHLQRALVSSRQIGMAMGILMECHRLTQEQAFERLRDLSMRSNVKLRDVAARIVYTGDTQQVLTLRTPAARSRPAEGKVRDAADADGQPSAGGDGDGTPWEGERHARSWWVSAEERDTRAEAADRQAEERDAAARARDDAADRLIGGARAREELAYRRIREVTRRLNALDAGEVHQHVHLQQAAETIQEAIDSRADEPLLQLLREVLKLLDVQFADLIAAGIQRSSLRVDLQHADQLLAGAADDRSAASADRSAAASDRAAAAGDRDSARTSRRSAAAYRAADEPGIQEH